MERGLGVRPSGERFPDAVVLRTSLENSAALGEQYLCSFTYDSKVVVEHLLCARDLLGPWVRLDKGPWCRGA